MEILVLLGFVFFLWLMFRNQEAKEVIDRTKEANFYKDLEKLYPLTEEEVKIHEKIVRSQINEEN